MIEKVYRIVLNARCVNDRVHRILSEEVEMKNTRRVGATVAHTRAKTELFERFSQPFSTFSWRSEDILAAVL